MKKMKTIYKIIALIIVIVAVAFGGYYFAKKDAGKTDSQKELEETVRDVSKLMVLPQDEMPTLATVTDIKKLEGQPFFANAKTGDKILIYTNNKKIILYSPSLSKIVEVGALNLNPNLQ